MPNWCEVDLRVYGEAGDIEDFMEFAKDDKEVLSADRFIPYPEHFKAMDYGAQKYYDDMKAGKDMEDVPRPKDGFNSGGYEWCIENWGTKWGLCRVERVPPFDDDGAAHFFMETAWSPPNPVILAMSRKFPMLRFEMEYFEQGMGFEGKYVCEGGEVVEDFYSEDYDGGRGG